MVLWGGRHPDGPVVSGSGPGEGETGAGLIPDRDQADRQEER